VRGHDAYLILSVEDDGVGFVDAVTAESAGGFGMKMIKTRDTVGAHFEQMRANPGMRFVTRVLV
jgi:two-component sensor histidine kinase